MPPTADRAFTNARVHSTAGRERTAEAVAVRDGRVVRVGGEDEVDSLVDAETDVAMTVVGGEVVHDARS